MLVLVALTPTLASALRVRGCDGDCNTAGFGLDGRIGYTFDPTARNSFNLAFELTPSWLSNAIASDQTVGVAILLGFQYL